MEMVISRVFLFMTSENLPLKLRKENLKILCKETAQKTDSNMDEEEYHLQSKFYYPEDLETSEAGISESSILSANILRLKKKFGG